MEQPREDAVGGVGVEVAGRLVGQEDRGIVGQTSGDGGALLLAAGKASRAVGRALREADRGEQRCRLRPRLRSEEHTSELQSLMRISYAVFCLQKKTLTHNISTKQT